MSSAAFCDEVSSQVSNHLDQFSKDGYSNNSTINSMLVSSLKHDTFKGS